MPVLAQRQKDQYCCVKSYAQHRTKVVQFNVIRGIERSRDLANDVRILKMHDRVGRPENRTSELWAENTGENLPAWKVKPSARELLRRVRRRSDDWEDCDSMRLIEGDLLDTVLKHMQSLTSRDELSTYKTARFDTVQVPTKVTNKPPITPETHKKMNVKFTFTYYAYNEKPCPKQKSAEVQEFLQQSGILKTPQVSRKKIIDNYSMGDVFIRTIVPRQCFSDIARVKRSDKDVVVLPDIKKTESAQTELASYRKRSGDNMAPVSSAGPRSAHASLEGAMCGDSNGSIGENASRETVISVENIVPTQLSEVPANIVSANTVPANTGSANTVPPNTVSANTASANSVATNRGSANTASAKTVPPNTGSANTVPPNTGSANTVSANAGSANTVSANTVPADSKQGGQQDKTEEQAEAKTEDRAESKIEEQAESKAPKTERESMLYENIQTDISFDITDGGDKSRPLQARKSDEPFFNGAEYWRELEKVLDAVEDTWHLPRPMLTDLKEYLVQDADDTAPKKPHQTPQNFKSFKEFVKYKKTMREVEKHEKEHGKHVVVPSDVPDKCTNSTICKETLYGRYSEKKLQLPAPPEFPALDVRPGSEQDTVPPLIRALQAKTIADAFRPIKAKLLPRYASTENFKRKVRVRKVLRSIPDPTYSAMLLKNRLDMFLCEHYIPRLDKRLAAVKKKKKCKLRPKPYTEKPALCLDPELPDNILEKSMPKCFELAVSEERWREWLLKRARELVVRKEQVTYGDGIWPTHTSLTFTLPPPGF